MVIRNLKENTIEIDGVVLTLAQDVSGLHIIDESASDQQSAPPSPAPVPAKEKKTPEAKLAAALKKKPPTVGREDSVTRRHALQNKLGIRKFRRYENLCFLKALARKLHGDEKPGSVSVVPETGSAISALFTDADSMRTWLEFSAQQPEEQDAILRHLAEAKSGEPKEEKVAETAAERFQLLDRHIRKVLRRTTLPFGKMEALEEEIIAAFEKNPQAVIVKEDVSGFDRLLIHGIAQYMFLTSDSQTVKERRVTTVRNTQAEFLRPVVTLTEYLETCDA